MSGLDANTKLLLHGDGADTSTNFPDVSPSGHTVTANNGAEVDTAEKKWGTGSLKLDGVDDYLISADNADWDLCGSNSDDWTIDFWVKHTDHVGNEAYLSQTETINSDEWRIIHQHGTGFIFTLKSGGGNVIILSGGGEITDTDWHHIAFIKVGDEYAFYKDGVQVNYVQDNSIDTFAASLGIGVLEPGGNNYDPLDGWMDEIRIQKSNYFGASPNAGISNTITIPTKAYEYKSASFIDYGPEYNFNAEETLTIATVWLDSTHFVVAYYSNVAVTGIYAKVGVVSNGNQISYGSEYLIDSSGFGGSGIRSFAIDRIDANNFVIVWVDGSGFKYGLAAIGVVSNGDEIAFGTAVKFNNAATGTDIDVAVLDTTHFVVAFRDDGGSDYGIAMIGVISSGDVITFGSEYNFNETSTYWIKVGKIDATHFVVIYDDDGGDGYGESKIGTVSSGDQIAYGSEFTWTSTDNPQHLGMAMLDSTHFVIAYRKTVDTWDGRVKIGTISGANISYESATVFLSGSSPTETTVCALDATHFVIGYSDLGDSGKGFCVFGIVSDGNTIAAGDAYEYNAVDTNYNAITKLDATHFVIAFMDDGGSDYGIARIGDIERNLTAKGSIQRLGVQKTITAKGRVQHTRTNSITAKGQIGAVSTSTINAKADILATTSKSIQAKSAIQKSFSREISSKSRIEKQFSQSIQAKANLSAVLTQTITSKASIFKGGTRTISAKAAIQKEFTKTITATAWIHNPLVPPTPFIEEINKTVRQLSFKVEIQWDGISWTDESTYFVSARGNEKLSKTSGEGIAATLDVELDNTTERFTPDNTSSPLYGYLKPRVPIRIYVTAGGYDYRIFTGYIKNLHPDTRSRICSLECFDNQVLVYNKRANGIVYEDYRSDQLMEALSDLAGLTADQYIFNVGTLVVNFGYFEDRNVWPVMGEIAVAERGRIFFDRYGILTFWNRDKLHNQSARAILPTISLSEWVVDLDYSVSEHEIKNTIIVQAKPRASAGVQVVWSSGNAEYLDPYQDTLVWIPAGKTQIAFLELEDPCTAFITPVANTDYTANSAQDGSGDDLTSDITIHEFINYGNAIFITVLNTGAQDAYLTKFQVRGNPAQVVKWIRVTATDDTSIAFYGKQDFSIENHFIDSEGAATAIANEELYRRKEAINLFKINIVGIPHLLCGDVINLEYRSGEFKDYMVGQLDWTFDSGGFNQKLILVNPYIFPSIQTVDARANII